MRAHSAHLAALGLIAQVLACGTGHEDAAAAALADTGTIAVEGAELTYRIEGQGRSCLVIGSATYYPRTFSRGLRNRLRLVFVDLRHFAPSDGSVPVAAITIDSYADDIEQVRRRLDLGRIVVIGHSIHGNLALEYARRYPRQVERIVVIGSPPVGLVRMGQAGGAYWEAEASVERKAAFTRNWERRGAEIRALAPEESFVPRYVANGPRYWADIDYDSTPLWDGVQVNGPVSDRLFGNLFSEYDLDAGATIETPVLIVMGRHDYVVPHTLWDAARGALPHHEYRLFEASGHTPQLEQPEAFDAALLGFLGVE